MTAAFVILLTAFGPFPGIPVNATALLVPRLAQRLRRLAAARSPLLPDAAISVHTTTLPTEWQRGPDRAEATIGRLRPDLVLHFGVSSQASGFVIERVGRSACQPHPDAAGHLAPSPTLGPAATHNATLPVDAICDRLSANGLPVSASTDAGGYLCNAVLYRTLSLPTGVRPPIAGFIHIPAALAGPVKLRARTSPETARPVVPSALTHSDFLTGAVHIAATCLAALAAERKIPHYDRA